MPNGDWKGMCILSRLHDTKRNKNNIDNTSVCASVKYALQQDRPSLLSAEMACCVLFLHRDGWQLLGRKSTGYGEDAKGRRKGNELLHDGMSPNRVERSHLLWISRLAVRTDLEETFLGLCWYRRPVLHVVAHTSDLLAQGIVTRALS